MNRLRPFVEALDARRLPSGGLSASLSQGVLTVVGTSGSDAIDLKVIGKGGPASTWNVEGVARFRLAKVHEIIIEGGDGDDSVAIQDNGHAKIPAWISEGSGNDTINGGSGADVIAVGNGDNQIWDSAGSTVSVGTGSDTINGVLQVAPVPVAPTPTDPTSTAPTTTTTTPVVSTPVATTPVATTPVSTTPTSTTPPTSPPSPVMPADPITPVSTPSTPAQTVAEIIALTNSDRAANGLPALAVDSQLMEAAQIHANDMATFEDMDHTLPEAADPTLQSRAAAVGYNYWKLGENIAAYYPDAPSVETAWMASTGHRANILDPSFTQFGVAVAFDADNLPYYCVVFGQPPG